MVYILTVLAGAADIFIKEIVERLSGDRFAEKNTCQEKGGKRFIIFRRVHNNGFPFGSLGGMKKLVKYLPLAYTALLLGRLSLLIPKKGADIEKLSLLMIIAGSASNLYDRFKRGYVVDYFSFNLKFIREIVFNIGDIMIFAGSLLFAFRERREG